MQAFNDVLRSLLSLQSACRSATSQSLPEKKKQDSPNEAHKTTGGAGGMEELARFDDLWCEERTERLREAINKRTRT